MPTAAKRSNKSLVWLVVGGLLLLMMATEAMRQRKFVLMTSSTGAEVCARDKPTTTSWLLIDMITQCGLRCLVTPTCLAYNFNIRTGQCDLYQDTFPINYAQVPGCRSFQIENRCSVNNGGCRPSATSATCENVPGGLVCTCTLGYYGNDILCAGSCRQTNALSGIYSLYTISGRQLKQVYCDKAAYTFIKPSDLTQLTLPEINAMFTNKSSFLMVALKSDGTQAYGVLEQLPVYKNYSLYLSLNEVTGYKQPVNAVVNFLGMNFLYFGFVPANVITPGVVQGLQVNGQRVAFTNCDGNPNSYMALFPSRTGKTPSSGWGWGADDTYSKIIAALQPLNAILPVSYFMFYETAWGGCGAYAQLDSSHSNRQVVGVTIGFR